MFPVCIPKRRLRLRETITVFEVGPIELEATAEAWRTHFNMGHFQCVSKLYWAFTLIIGTTLVSEQLQDKRCEAATVVRYYGYKKNCTCILRYVH